MTDLFGSIEKKEFWDGLMRGDKGDCPCCGRYAQVYKRQVNSTCVVKLIKCFKLGGETEYVHGGAVHIHGMSGAGDFSVAKYWGLLEQKYHEPDEKKSSGYWRLTEKGIDFIGKLITIPKYALVFDDQLIRLEGEQVSIVDCLGEKFNYAELMAS